LVAQQLAFVVVVDAQFDLPFLHDLLLEQFAFSVVEHFVPLSLHVVFDELHFDFSALQG